MTLHAVTSGDLQSDAVALLLHGYDADEQQLVGLAPALPAGMPWAALRAPVELEPGKYGWYQVYDIFDPSPAVVAPVVAAVRAWIDENIPAGARLVPIGFSQGALIATELLRSDAARILTAVLLAGFVAAGEREGDADLRQRRPAVYSARGEYDRAIKPFVVGRTEAWLDDYTRAIHGVYPGVGHGITASELVGMQAFLTHEVEEAAR